MVDVTRSNFDLLLPLLQQRIKSCHFIAVDAEYVGLHSPDFKNQNSLFDSAGKRYDRLRDNFSKFSICQIGLGIYEKDKESPSTYFVNAYNFYVLPVAFDSFAKRDLLISQTSCINFLARNNFDFNKFLKQGVPFLNKGKRETLEKFLKANRYFMNTCEYLDPDYFPWKKEFLTDEDIELILDRLEGFSKVIQLIQAAQKPLVGHNMLTDLLLIYQQFIDELPRSYSEFKKNLHEMFPIVYDTKCVAHGVSYLREEYVPEDRTLCDTNLFALYTNCSSIQTFRNPKPCIQPVNETLVYHAALTEGFNQNLQTLKTACCHNAAFDAVVTGAVFLKLGYIASRPQPNPDYRSALPPTLTEVLKRVSCWKDQVNVIRAAVSHIHLSKPDPESTRPDWIKASLPGGKPVNPGRLRQELARFGDVEIEVLGPGEVILACGGIGCANKVWTELKHKEYLVSKVKASVLLGHDFKLRVGLALVIFGVACFFSRKKLSALVRLG